MKITQGRVVQYVASGDGQPIPGCPSGVDPEAIGTWPAIALIDGNDENMTTLWVFTDVGPQLKESVPETAEKVPAPETWRWPPRV